MRESKKDTGSIFTKKIKDTEEPEIQDNLEEESPKAELDLSKKADDFSSPEKRVASTELSGTNVLTRTILVDGFVDDIRKVVSELSPGEIPIALVKEEVVKRRYGRARYLLVIRKIPGSIENAVIVEAKGIDDLNRKLSEKLTTETKVLLAMSPVNKRDPQNMYVAILVKE